MAVLNTLDTAPLWRLVLMILMIVGRQNISFIRIWSRSKDVGFDAFISAKITALVTGKNLYKVCTRKCSYISIQSV